MDPIGASSTSSIPHLTCTSRAADLQVYQMSKMITLCYLHPSASTFVNSELSYTATESVACFEHDDFNAMPK